MVDVKATDKPTNMNGKSDDTSYLFATADDESVKAADANGTGN